MEHQGADRKRARARDRRASHRHCNTAGRDPAQIRKTAAGLFKDTFDDLDGYLSTAERYAVHVDLARCRAILTLSALSHRLGDELIPKLAQIG